MSVMKMDMKAGVLKMSLRRLITWLIPLLTVCISNIMDKHNKLVLFLGRKDAVEIAGENQVALMERQKIQMHDYLITLKDRIELMKK